MNTEICDGIAEEKEADTAADISADSKKVKTKKHRFSVQLIVIAVLLLICGALNVAAWKSTAFSDWYTANILPLWQNTYGRLTSLLPFSFGEILIMIGVFGVPLLLILMIVLLIVKKGRRKKVGKVFGLIFLWMITFVIVTETLNCFVLYHCSSFAELNGIPTDKHTHAELESLGDMLVTKTNTLAKKVSRDSKGRFVLTADLDETAQKAMQNLSKEFKNLDGYYVKPKKIMCSFFMSQINLMGIYFPFSMEANINKNMYTAKQPDTACHELSHTKGYIQEDEANFIAFMACDRSGNTDYEYSGYLSALNEVRNKIFSYASEEQKIKFDSSIDDSVWTDIEANSEYWKSVREAKDTVISSETAGKAADKAMDTSLKLNGVSDGLDSYGRMVDLMLNYYKSKGLL